MNSDGQLHYTTLGFLSICGSALINDRKEHVVALRHTLDDCRWSIYVDGNKQGSKVVMEKAASPDGS